MKRNKRKSKIKKTQPITVDKSKNNMYNFIVI